MTTIDSFEASFILALKIISSVDQKLFGFSSRIMLLGFAMSLFMEIY